MLETFIAPASFYVVFPLFVSDEVRLSRDAKYGKKFMPKWNWSGCFLFKRIIDAYAASNKSSTHHFFVISLQNTYILRLIS